MPQAASAIAQGYRLVELEAIDSTNAEAMRRAAAGEAGPLWIRAETQLLGRGRSGRTWTSVPGNLYASLLTRATCPPEAISQVSLLTGVAVVDALRSAAAARGRQVPGLRLKWPNDVLIGNAKLAGVLPESSAIPGSRAITLVIGIGINLAGHPPGLPRAVTHLAAHGPHLSAPEALHHVSKVLDGWLGVWMSGSGFAEVRRAWLDRAGPVGEAMAVETGIERIEGQFEDIDGTGALILRDRSGNERRFTYGDVTLSDSVPGRSTG